MEVGRGGGSVKWRGDFRQTADHGLFFAGRFYGCSDFQNGMEGHAPFRAGMDGGPAGGTAHGFILADWLACDKIPGVTDRTAVLSGTLDGGWVLRPLE